MSDGLKLSYLYLDQFRTIENSELSFDHRYRFLREMDTGTIRYGAGQKFSLAAPYFYGDKVYSVSCIVGRNGEGKTSMVDFIHESFLLMLQDLSNSDAEHGEQERSLPYIDPKTGAVVLTDGDKSFYHLEYETKFLVIFSLNGNDYYLTNIPFVFHDERITPYKAGFEDQKTIEEYCVAYFSMMRFRTGVTESEMRIGREGDEATLRGLDFGLYSNLDMYRGIETLFGENKTDLSEMWIDAMQQSVNVWNFDVLFQLVFIYLHEDLTIKCLGKDFGDRMQINYINDPDANVTTLISLREILRKDANGDLDMSMIGKIITDPRSYIRPFSSGQYSRFALLARLHWFLEGSERFTSTPFSKLFETEAEYKAIEKSFIHRKPDNELGAVLLFDEGDLFYHPEWQREFVGDILEVVKSCAKSDMQIVFTTNSPFMMSDMLREDIVTLTREKNKFDENVLTFGQNVHTLLAHRFFLDSTIGSVSEHVIGWLIALLADPEKGVRKLEAEKREIPHPVERDDTGEVTEFGQEEIFEEHIPTEKEIAIFSIMEEKQHSLARAEAIYVNKSVYDEFTGYCVSRGWGPSDDKNEFLEALVSSIGEEIYRKRLRYRYQLYRERISEVMDVISTEDAERVIRVLKDSGSYSDNVAFQQVVEHLQKFVDRSEE